MRRTTLMIVGLVMGLGLGLTYTWGIDPIEFVNTDPQAMYIDYRNDWIQMVAFGYVSDGDLDRARTRLAGFNAEDVSLALGGVIEECAAAGRPADMMRRLSELAAAMDVYTPAMAIYLQTPGPAVSGGTSNPEIDNATPAGTPEVSPGGDLTPGPSIIATPTPKPTNTPTPTPTPLPPFQLASSEQICEPEQEPHIEVIVQDTNGNQISGIEVWLMWAGRADRAVTGLKPQYGPGYVDFDVSLGERYAVGTSELGVPLVSDLEIELCPVDKDKDPYPASWRVVFERRPATSSSEMD